MSNDKRWDDLSQYKYSLLMRSLKFSSCAKFMFEWKTLIIDVEVYMFAIIILPLSTKDSKSSLLNY